MDPVYGASDGPYDEKGCRAERFLCFASRQKLASTRYIAIPPCVWGDPRKGLLAPDLLPIRTEFISVKRTNSTFRHTGVMAPWQMKGVLVPKEEASGPRPWDRPDRRGVELV